MLSRVKFQTSLPPTSPAPLHWQPVRCFVLTHSVFLSQKVRGKHVCGFSIRSRVIAMHFWGSKLHHLPRPIIGMNRDEPLQGLATHILTHTTATVGPSPKKLRVLCLHGYACSGPIFQFQLSSLMSKTKEDVEYFFLDGINNATQVWSDSLHTSPCETLFCFYGQKKVSTKKKSFGHVCGRSGVCYAETSGDRKRSYAIGRVAGGACTYAASTLGLARECLSTHLLLRCRKYFCNTSPSPSFGICST